jgi:hypothetical protein
VEARSQDRVGVDPVGASNAMRGSVSSNRVTPACLIRTFRMRKPLKSRLGDVCPGRRTTQSLRTTRREGRVERHTPLPRRETLWKRKPKGVTGMKQGRKGCRRNKAPRG